ncbi:NUP43 [Cordylochernes scorpioides]|uniref:NUP43 n=1 Tax=Cordylochernes scorpioides TaxID=51811 RepID=A0ABY6JUK2_9ARAC|nr:NUP43 [Cordylochernes scorpioides]
MEGATTPLSPTTASSHLNISGLCSSGWLPINNILFQVANLFLLFSYFATTSHFGVIYLRICLMLGSLFFALWGWIILCAFDTLLWNSVFTIINMLHIIILLYQLRPIGFNAEMEQVYKELFKPMKVSKHSFKKLISAIKEVRILKPPDTFCVEKKSRLDQLSLVLSGR